MRSRRCARMVLVILVGAVMAGGAPPAPALSTTAAVAPQETDVVILEDFSDVVTQVDAGFDDFGGNMGAIHEEYLAQMALQCPAEPPSCSLRLGWDFGTAAEAFTGLFLSLFGLTDTQATFDGTTVETVSFPEHSLDLDQIDGVLAEPLGPRSLSQLCFRVAYEGAQDLKLRVELKDALGGMRFQRFSITSDTVPQTHCWDFRTTYTVPAGSPDLDIHQAKVSTFIIERRHVADGVENPVSGLLDVHRVWFTLDPAEAKPATNEALLDLLERRTYQYFLDWSSRKAASRDIPQDRSTFGDLLTVGGVGFAAAAHVVAAERGWIPRGEAAERVGNILRVLDDADAFGPEPVGRLGYKGWFYHFLGVDGRRKLNFDFPETPEKDESLNTVELSTIDTSLALMGILAAQSYFDDPADPVEIEIRARAQSIYDRVEWSFLFESQSSQFYLGWKPNEDREGPAFEIADGDGLGSYSGIPDDPATLDYYTDEALMAILLTAGSETDPVPPEAYCALYYVPNEQGLIRTYPGALFTYQFLHAFLDTRTWRSICGSMDWFGNTRSVLWQTIAYAEANPRGYSTYGPDAWGLSAAEGPSDAYCAYGAPPVALNPVPEEDGTVTYYAMLSAAGFGDDLRARATDALHAAWDRGHWHPRFGLPDAFHAQVGEADLPIDALRQSGPWVQRALFAIDQGPMLLHLENARSGLIHRLLARNPNVQRGLSRLVSLVPQQFVIQGEDGSGDGAVMARSNAWGQQTIWLQDGQSRAWVFSSAGGRHTTLWVRYSNDNYGPEEMVSLALDGVHVGDFSAHDTGDYGYGWNVFVLSDPISVGEVGAGEHTLTATVSGGDGYGVEIDAIVLDTCVDRYCGLLPRVCRMP